MNIFVLDNNIRECAKAHCDKHVIKMILESAQLLSGAVRLSGIDAGYRLTHKNHPCSIWTRESLSNWKWLRELVVELNSEYQYRYNKDVNHKSYDTVMELPEPEIEDIGLTEFKLAMPDQYRTADPVESYRKYYIGEKRNIAKWTKRNRPTWYK